MGRPGQSEGKGALSHEPAREGELELRQSEAQASTGQISRSRWHSQCGSRSRITRCLSRISSMRNLEVRVSSPNSLQRASQVSADAFDSQIAFEMEKAYLDPPATHGGEDDAPGLFGGRNRFSGQHIDRLASLAPAHQGQRRIGEVGWLIVKQSTRSCICC